VIYIVAVTNTNNVIYSHFVLLPMSMTCRTAERYELPYLGCSNTVMQHPNLAITLGFPMLMVPARPAPVQRLVTVAFYCAVAAALPFAAAAQLDVTGDTIIKSVSAAAIEAAATARSQALVVPEQQPHRCAQKRMASA
jgi:hypothetical protein